jgi:hypothetical protein
MTPMSAASKVVESVRLRVVRVMTGAAYSTGKSLLSGNFYYAMGM